MENPLATEAFRAKGGPWLVNVRAPFIAPWGNSAHHPYPARTLLPTTSTLHALPHPAPLYCAHHLAHHPHRTRILSPTTHTVRGSRILRTPHKTRRNPDVRSHGNGLSPEVTTPPAAARSPCAQPLAHHLVPLPSPPPLPCAHSLAHHPYLAHTLLLTTPTLRALSCSPPLPMHGTPCLQNSARHPWHVTLCAPGPRLAPTMPANRAAHPTLNLCTPPSASPIRV